MIGAENKKRLLGHFPNDQAINTTGRITKHEGTFSHPDQRKGELKRIWNNRFNI
jgi:muconolactone delta-isomerase